MSDRNGGLGAVKANDAATAEGLADEDFIFEGEDGQLVGAGSDYGDGDDLSADDVVDGTETPQELGESDEGEGEGEEPAEEAPAEQAAQTSAGNQTPTSKPQTTPQAAASGSSGVQQPRLFHELVRDNYDAAVDHVVRQGHFSLSQKEAEVIDPAAAPVLQRMAAQVYLKSVATVSQMLHESLPVVVRNLQQVGSQEQQAEQAFMQSYGFKDEHKATLTATAHFVRSQRPDLSGKAYADEVAKVARAYLGLPAQAAKQGKTQAGSPAGARTVTRKAFTPAGQTGGANAPRRAPGQPPAKKDPMQDLNDFLRSGADVDE